MSKNALPWVMTALLALSSACTRDQSGTDDPKKRLSDYISKSFAVKSGDDRRELLEFLTGDAKSRLAAWSDDQFKAAFIDTKRTFVKLLVREVKEVEPRQKVNVTYELTYMTPGAEKGNDTKVTQKKLCLMTQEGGKWQIAEVRSLKELVEYQKEMSLP